MEKYQTGFRRFLALIIDGLIFFPVDWLNQTIWDLKAPIFGFFFWAIIYSLLGVVYYVYMHAKFGQTIGKWICKVKVLDHDSEDKISTKQAVLRDIVPVVLIPYSIYVYSASYSAWLTDATIEQNTLDLFLAFALGMWGLLEIISMLTNEKRRAIHDFIANTVVVRVPGKSIQPNAEASAD